MPASWLPLVAIIALAFTVEAAMGFGATLIALSLGSLVTTMDAMLAAFVPLNVALSLAIVLRGARHVNLRVLLTRMVPAMALGFPIGLFAFERLPRAASERAFAVFVIVLAGVELLRLAKPKVSARPLPNGVAFALLLLGGVAHGAFASGGPPAVYVGARTLADKASFRATMSALWLVLNGALVIAYAIEGQVDAVTFRTSATLAPGLVVGLFAGEMLHGRIPERAFRVVVLTLLVVVAIVLTLRA